MYICSPWLMLTFCYSLVGGGSGCRYICQEQLTCTVKRYCTDGQGLTFLSSTSVAKYWRRVVKLRCLYCLLRPRARSIVQTYGAISWSGFHRSAMHTYADICPWSAMYFVLSNVAMSCGLAELSIAITNRRARNEQTQMFLIAKPALSLSSPERIRLRCILLWLFQAQLYNFPYHPQARTLPVPIPTFRLQ